MSMFPDEQPQPEEETVALDAHVKALKRLWEATENIKFWRTEYEKAKAEMERIMGTATIGTVDGRQVVTFRYEDRFRGDEFKKRYPDTWRTFVTDVTEKKFNLALFKASRPDLYEEFRVRSMKPKGDPTE